MPSFGQTPRPTHALALAALLAGAGCSSGAAAPLYTRAETNTALTPLRRLDARCNGPDAGERPERAELEFAVHIDAAGSVHAEPVAGVSADPALIECVRLALDELHFPARGSREQLRLRFAFAERPNSAQQAQP